MKVVIKLRNNTFETDFLSILEGDDPTFIRNCEKVIQSRIIHWNPKELFIIGINTIFYTPSVENTRPFPEKFSFVSSGDKLEVSRYHPDIYKISTTPFLRSYRGYEEKTHASYIKRRKREEHKYYDCSYGPREYHYKSIDDGLIIYYTKNTLSEDKGTIMFFYKSYNQYEAALVTLGKDSNWNVSDSYGISIPEIQEIINS